MKKGNAVLLLICTAILWSTGGLLIKSIDWHPLAIAGGRSGIATLVILSALGKTNFTCSRSQILGAVFYALTVSLFVTANKLTTAANAILLQYTAPIYVALFSNWFLRERVSRMDWFTILTVVAGMTLFFMDHLSTSGLWGNIVAIASGISFAWLTLIMREQRAASPLKALFLGNLLTALVFLPFIYFSPSLNFKGGFSLLLLGVFQLGLPYILYAKAQVYVKALEVILIFMIEPLLNPIWVLLVMGERPSLWSLIGGFVIIGAISVRGIILAVRKL